MPPKARNAPGRRAAATEEAPIALPLKRGRAPKADAFEATLEPPKKRGRPVKAKAEEPIVEAAPEPKKRGRPPKVAPEPAIEALVVKRGRGRPKKEVLSAQEEVAVKNRRGRPPKTDVIADAPPATRKPGRPARTAAIDLNRVVGSSRIGKRSSPRTKAKAEPVARRLDPRVRSKLRIRLPPAKKTITAESVTKPVPKPTSRRGRPPNNTVSAPKEPAVVKPAKPAKPLAPRKMRGHTVRQIPDRYVAQVDEYLQELIEADASPVEEEQAEDEIQGEDGSIAEDAAEDGQDALVSSEQDREQYQEYSDDGGIDVDGAEDAGELPENVEFLEENNGNNKSPEEDDDNNGKDENAEPVQQVEVSI